MMSRLSRRWVVPSAAAALMLTACGHSGSSAPSSLSAEGTPTQISAAALTAINLLRAQAGEPLVTENTALDTAAAKHAAWMVLHGTGFTHYETVDGTPTGAPATTNPFYVGVAPPARAQAANAGADVVAGAQYAEAICSLPGARSIPWLWYSIYHRLPLMRSDTTLAGFGDQDAALGMFPGMGLPAGSGFSTVLVASNPAATTIIASSWPPAGAVGILPSFDPSTEVPNAFNPSNTGQNPATPTTGRLGPPLHVILPTSRDWASVSVTLVDPTSIAVPVYILCGGATIPALPVPPNAATSQAFTDTHLRQGELILVPKAPLQSNATYTVSVSASTTGATPDTVQLGISTPWTFTTAE